MAPLSDGGLVLFSDASVERGLVLGLKRESDEAHGLLVGWRVARAGELPDAFTAHPDTVAEIEAAMRSRK